MNHKAHYSTEKDSPEWPGLDKQRSNCIGKQESKNKCEYVKRHWCFHYFLF